ncbi:LysR family transcriptional regulator [Paenibacillus sp. MSJ-34]|uniref:LysR family transcriptional regulator n=1 Tax=Paenibacillus sp. MSJ-34 TaxID=2841529 RepID=UPI001C106014|nr:LysR family transcriptional regulator [Paenibacillus sp. MSJ-34]
MIVETLKVYAAVVEHSHFSRAAEALNISQPGVSLHIRNLENEFGAKLIHRSPKYVKVTEAGNILYQRAKQILALYEEAKQQIRLLQDVVTGALKIGASFTLGEYILPRVLAQFAASHPQVDVQVIIANTEQIAQSVHRGELDLGLVEGQVHYSDLQVSYFMEDEMLLVAPPDHPLTLLPSVEAGMLQDQIWIFRESGSGTRAFSDRVLEQLQLRAKHSFIFSSNQGVKEAVASGLGISVLSHLVVNKALDAGEICPIRVKSRRFVRNCSIVQAAEPSESLAVNVFADHLAEFAKRHQPRP